MGRRRRISSAVGGSRRDLCEGCDRRDRVADAVLYLIHKVTIAPRLLGKLSTVLQLALVVAALLGPDMESSLRDFWRKMLLFLWVSVVGVAALATIDYVVQGTKQ